MTLTPLDLEAMFVRHEAAIALRKMNEIDGLTAIEMVLLPTRPLLDASLARARSRGVSSLSKRLLAAPKERKPYGPRRWRAEQLSHA